MRKAHWPLLLFGVYHFCRISSGDSWCLAIRTKKEEFVVQEAKSVLRSLKLRQGIPSSRIKKLSILQSWWLFCVYSDILVIFVKSDIFAVLVEFKDHQDSSGSLPIGNSNHVKTSVESVGGIVDRRVGTLTFDFLIVSSMSSLCSSRGAGARNIGHAVVDV